MTVIKQPKAEKKYKGRKSKITPKRRINKNERLTLHSG
jgi:hypothetical protein